MTVNANLLRPDFKPNSYYNSQRTDMLNYVPQNISKVLEIGCGEGEFGLLMRNDRKADIWGIEISQSAAAKAALKLNHVLIGDFENENIEIPKRFFDCVIFNDVLEHFKYPWNVLVKILEYTTDDAYVVASIPNVRYYHVIRGLVKFKEWQYVDEGVLDKTHLRFFTENSIKDMFNMCGYKIIRINGINGMDKFPLKLNILNWVMRGAFDDLKFKQFACVAQRIRN